MRVFRETTRYSRLAVQILAVTVILFWGGNVRAACQLYVNGGGTPEPLSIEPLNGVISAPPDLPVGTILYRGVLQSPQPNIGVQCDQKGQFYYSTSLTSALGVTGYTAGIPPFSNIPGNMPVYKTNLPGVGAAVNTTDLLASSGCVDEIACYRVEPTTALNLRIYLVKTGDITPGIINGGQLPVYSYMLGQSGQQVSIVTRQFSGQVTITVPTCTTPDVEVNMGTWKVNQFTGKGSATDWRDSSLVLSNCPSFYGYGASHTTSYGTEITYSPAATLNSWALNLSPQNGTVDSAKGIMAIDNTVQNAASGVGIQLGYGTVTSAASSLVDFAVQKTGAIPSTGINSITIPLAARYIQTEDRVTPGRADGKVIFTISYK